jgi:hypothetical protein
MERNLKFKYPEFIIQPLFSKAKFSIIKAGRRTGKTYNTVQWICEELLEDTRSGLWVDTTQANLGNYVDLYFRQILKPIWDLMNWNAQKYILTFPNGSYIHFRSAERPELMEGFEYTRGVINEAGIVFKKSSLWDNTLQPMFKGKTTKVRFVGTPKGKNKYADLYARGQDGNEKDWESYTFSAYDSPYWDQDELEKIKPQIPQEVWKQEYLAEFIDGAGSVFRNISGCIQNETYDKPKPNYSYVMSVDLAKHTDFTVIYVAERETKKIIYQERFNQIDWGFQKARIQSVYDRFGVKLGIVDSTGVGDSIFDDLVNMGMYFQGFKFTSTSKNQLIQNLSVAIDNQDLTFFRFPELISELEIYGYEVSAMGNIRYNAPDGYHDDCVISLALINQLLQVPKINLEPINL